MTAGFFKVNFEITENISVNAILPVKLLLLQRLNFDETSSMARK